MNNIEILKINYNIIDMIEFINTLKFCNNNNIKIILNNINNFININEFINNLTLNQILKLIIKYKDIKTKQLIHDNIYNIMINKEYRNKKECYQLLLKEYNNINIIKYKQFCFIYNSIICSNKFIDEYKNKLYKINNI